MIAHNAAAADAPVTIAPEIYPQDKHLIVHEIRRAERDAAPVEAMVILPTVLQRLGALGRDQVADRAELLLGGVIHLDNGTRFMLTARSLFENETKRQEREAPHWYVTHLAMQRGRAAVRMYEIARAQAEFIAQGAETREEGAQS